jgi:hypothetical protein
MEWRHRVQNAISGSIAATQWISTARVATAGLKRSSNEPARCGTAFLLSAARQRPKGKIMKQGDYVKVIGRDGFYVFLKEVQGTATLRVGGAKSPDTPTLAIPINRVVSLEKTEQPRRLSPGG